MQGSQYQYLVPDRKRPAYDWESLPLLATTPEWRARAAAELKRQFGRQAEFAEWIGGSQAGVSQTLGGKQPTSKYVVPMCEQLGLPYPTMSPDVMVQRINDIAQELDPDILAAQLKIFESLAGKAAKRQP